MQITLSITFDVSKPSLGHILHVFIHSLRPILEALASQVVQRFAEQYKADGTLAKLYRSTVAWKSSHGNRMTTILTIFGKIRLPQIQVRVRATGRKVYITRRLLGVESNKRIPAITRQLLAYIGALVPYRAGARILEAVAAAKIPLMAIQRAVCRVASRLRTLTPTQVAPVFEADGTGVPTGASKRGEELKILTQRQPGGGIRIVGMGIGQYHGGWEAIMRHLREAPPASRRKTLLVSDGDPAIAAAAGLPAGQVQRCLWHLPSELKYALWKDGVTRSSAVWRWLYGAMLGIVRAGTRRETALALTTMDEMIAYAGKHGLKYAKTYLSNARGGVFNALRRGVQGGTTSLTERVMRTLNQRINVGRWSARGVLAAAKIRAAIYYNGWQVVLDRGVK